MIISFIVTGFYFISSFQFVDADNILVNHQVLKELISQDRLTFFEVLSILIWYKCSVAVFCRSLIYVFVLLSIEKMCVVMLVS
jgi:hypothetical protein